MIQVSYAKFKDALHIGGTTRTFIDVRRPECKLMKVEVNLTERSIEITDEKLKKVFHVPLENVVVYELTNQVVHKSFKVETENKPELPRLAIEEEVEFAKLGEEEEIEKHEQSHTHTKKKPGRPAKHA